MMEAVPNSQASTQGFRETQEIAEVPVDFLEMDRVVIWGRLFSVRENVSVYNLCNEVHTFGRGSVDHKFDESQFDDAHLVAISKKHFKISQVRRSAIEVCIVIEDLSQNGTYVNQQLIGRGNRKILQSNDEIALAHPTKKVFVFHDCLNNDAADYPKQLTEQYTMTKKLGEGTFGEVRLAYRQGTLERVAVKILKKKGSKLLINNVKQIDNEIRLLQSVNHRNIIRLRDVIDTPDKIFIIMEVAEGGELFDRLITNRRLPEITAKFYFYQLVLAVQYLHVKSITHRDIKPENVLLASDKEFTHVKLTDFGLSKLAADTSQMTTFCGTPTYIAPELLALETLSYTNKVDMWSLGVVLYVSLVGYPPFDGSDDVELRYKIKNAIYNFKNILWNNVSYEAKDIIKKLMVKDPQHRLSATQTLNHPWLQDENLKSRILKLDNNVDTTTTKRKHDDDDNDHIDVSNLKTPKLNLENLCNKI